MTAQPRARKPRRERRKAFRRARYGRRRSDRWRELGTLLGLISSMTGGIVGQAELLGEPYRHWVTVACIAATGGFGYLLGPESIRRMLEHRRKQRT